jgi:hypothetical protein
MVLQRSQTAASLFGVARQWITLAQLRPLRNYDTQPAATEIKSSRHPYFNLLPNAQLKKVLGHRSSFSIKEQYL